MKKTIINEKYPFVTYTGFCQIREIYCHEHVIKKSVNKFVSYLEAIGPPVIIPSIIICDKTYVILDGHHRYFSLIRLGYNKCPITAVDYQNDRIIPHIDSDITKEIIINAGITGKLLPPKSSEHHFIDEDEQIRPLMLISYLSDMH